MSQSNRNKNEDLIDTWELLKKRNNMERTDSENDNEQEESDQKQIGCPDSEEELEEQQDSEDYSDQEDSSSEKINDDEFIANGLNMLTDAEIMEKVNRTNYPYFRHIMLDYYVKGSIRRP
jgi:hypothetical protein